MITNDFRLINSLFNLSALDQMMVYLAFTAMRSSGHRHGAFLDAASTAAKCAIYMTYMEQNENVRMTGQLHHIEPKRVKAIVEEIKSALIEGKLVKMLGTSAPGYLIEFPYVWMEYFPWKPGESRIKSTYLNKSEKQTMLDKLPLDLPDAQVIGQLEFLDLIQKLYERHQKDLPENQRSELSEALGEHIKRRLIHSETVKRIDCPGTLPFYALLRPTYSPSDHNERLYTMIEDISHYFCMMQDWIYYSPSVLRAVEEFDIDPDKFDEAKLELDQFIRKWADKYHRSQHENNKTVIIQLVFGEKIDKKDN